MAGSRAKSSFTSLCFSCHWRVIPPALAVPAHSCYVNKALLQPWGSSSLPSLHSQEAPTLRADSQWWMSSVSTHPPTDHALSALRKHFKRCFLGSGGRALQSLSTGPYPGITDSPVITSFKRMLLNDIWAVRAFPDMLVHSSVDV